MNPPESRAWGGLDRVLLFSDAVFAIAITLLVLDIKLPRVEPFSESALLDQLLRLLPRIIGFVASFLIIGILWIEHHRIFRFIRAYDGGLLWRNLLFLLCVSFVPFPTAVFSEYLRSRTALVLYAITFAGAGLLKRWIWLYAAGRGQLLDGSVDPETVRRISRRSLALPAGCGLAILLSLASVWLAPLGFALIPLLAKLLDPGRGRKPLPPATPQPPPDSQPPPEAQPPAGLASP